MANSTASRLSTGSAPGRPRQTGQTLVLGDAPKLVGQPQKILVAVASWTCTSSPMTASKRAMASGLARSRAGVDIFLIIVGQFGDLPYSLQLGFQFVYERFQRAALRLLPFHHHEIAAAVDRKSVV